jgi:hypothetical protein
MNNSQQQSFTKDIKNTNKCMPDINTTITNFKFSDVNNKLITANKIKGYNKILIFWEPYAKESINSIASIDTLVNSIKPKNLKVFPICIDGGKDEIETSLNEIACTLPYYTDIDKSCKWRFRVAEYPNLYLLDKNNKLIYRQNYAERESPYFLEDYIRQYCK